MKRALLSGLIVALIGIGGHTSAVAAQLTSEQRAKIRELLRSSAVVTITAAPTVGRRLADNVPLIPAPSSWGPAVAKYGYVVTPVPVVSAEGTTYDVAANNKQLVLVEPSSRKVLDIVR